MIAFFENLFRFVASQFAFLKWTDVLDIFVLSLLVFGLYHLLHDTRAANLAVGVGILLILWVVASLMNMHALTFLLRAVFDVGILAIIVIFQPEIRSLLEKVGEGSWRGIKTFGEQKDTDVLLKTISVICEAAQDLSKSHTGGLIVIERNTKLGDIVRTGITVDALPSTYLICNIFFDKAPMHDGAVIIRGNRVCAAGCKLPLSESKDIALSLGTRHRAALGMSEKSDALVVVVSEETSIISLAYNGILTQGYSCQGLKKALTDKLMPVSKREEGSFLD
ncbi:MAG: diadenylate cyclase CdaA [Clostridia bacterium]|nr:diadenylate cyclase CdaA [Clostridia bacterium]